MVDKFLGNLSIPCIGYIQKFRYLCCYILCIPLGTNNSKELIKNIEDKKKCYETNKKPVGTVAQDTQHY